MDFLLLLPFYYLFVTPLATSILLLSFGKNLNLNVAKRLSVSSSIGMSTYVYIISFIFFENGGENSEVLLLTWFNIGGLVAPISIFSDALTLIMLCVITCVSNCVHTYSIGYMKSDPNLLRFLSYLHLFTFFMIVLVTAGNFLQLFMGWEGVGLSSYLLINFWYTRIQANKSAVKALIINRIGDTSLAIAIFLIFSNFGTLDFVNLSTILNDPNYFLIDVNTIVFFLFVAAMGKSAQVGLHSWLPDAMEGPTPVSALIHAATMVTAGVFLIIRCSFLFQEAVIILPFVTLIGGFTCFLGSTVAACQNDIKRIIAYSTCSQLGYMVMSCGLTCFPSAIFHLYTHAFFKALLFLTAGNLIHAFGNEQDMRRLGALSKTAPFTYSMLLVGSLALMGIPSLSGNFSKEHIIEMSYIQFSDCSHFSSFLGTFSASCTSFYSCRLLMLLFYTEMNSPNKHPQRALQEPNYTLSVPIISLALSSIFAGHSFRRIFNGTGSPFWSNSISLFPSNYYESVNVHFIPIYIKVIPAVSSGICGIIALSLYTFISENHQLYKNHKMYTLYTFLNRKWFFDGINNDFLTHYSYDAGYSHLFKPVDRGILEILCITGLSQNLSLFGLYLKQDNKGLIYDLFSQIVLLFVVAITLYILFFFGMPLLLLFSIVTVMFLNN